MAITPSSQHTLTGWLFVLAQAMLLIALIAVPRADDWPVPTWLNLTGVLLAGFGLLVMVAAALRLGPNLTPTPMPKAHGQLTTTGLYRYSRHPIYTGVLVLVVGIVVRSGSLLTLAIGVVTVAFFTAKAAWEEQRLREHYPDYAAYAASTGRFFPRLARR